MVCCMNMLLVDDDESTVRVLTDIIRDSFDGRVALTAMTDPVAAKQWIEENTPDLVLTDLRMPEVDGFEILRCTKRHNRAAQVVIYSAYFSTTSLGEAIELGVTDYVPKCSDPENLLTALEYAHTRFTRWSQAKDEVTPWRQAQCN